MSGNRALTGEREQQLAEARALRQGYQQSGTFHANGSRGGRPRPRAPGGRASPAAGQGRGGMRTTSRVSAGARAYVNPGTQRYSDRNSAGSPLRSSTGNRRTENYSVPAQRANVTNTSDLASKPQARVVSYYQTSSNNISGVASGMTTTATPAAACGDLSAPATVAPVVTTNSLRQGAPIKSTTTAATESTGRPQKPVNRAPTQSSIAHDWNTAQLADESEPFDVDPDFGNGTGSVAVPVTDRSVLTPSVPVSAVISTQPRDGFSAPGAAATNNTPSAAGPAPNTVWHWNYQDEAAGPDIIPVAPVAADLDAMDVDDETPSPPEVVQIWNRPAKKRIPCSCVRGLGQSRWAESSGPTPTSHGHFSYQPQTGKSSGTCAIHGGKNNFRSGNNDSSTLTTGGDGGGN